MRRRRGQPGEDDADQIANHSQLQRSSPLIYSVPLVDIVASLEKKRSLYLFCTWTPALWRFSPIEHFDFSKLFENLRIVVERLPPPPPIIVEFLPEFARFRPLFPPPPRFLHAGNLIMRPPLVAWCSISLGILDQTDHWTSPSPAGV
jgi:hypothetical protein